MFRLKLRDLASRLRARLEAGAEALGPRPQLRPIPVRVQPPRRPVRD